MKRNMKIVIALDGTYLKTAIQLDDHEFFVDGSNLISEKAASGAFADIFHELTGRRFKETTDPLPTAKLLLSRIRGSNLHC